MLGEEQRAEQLLAQGWSKGLALLAFSSQHLAQDSDSGCPDSLAVGGRCGQGMELCQGELSAFHSERKGLDSRTAIQGSSCPALPALSQLQVPGSGKTLPVNEVTFCTKTFTEILWWSRTVHIGLDHGVVTICELILYLQPAEGLGHGAALV